MHGIGRIYKDFQIFVLELYKRGVILAICSKNDKNDILRAFREHSGMILKEEHIAYFAVNWNNKASNIQTISKMLNIDLDSIVFVDDSTEEISEVKALCPEVTVIKFQRDMDYSLFSCFSLKNYVDMSIIENRNKTYRTNVQREILKSSVIGNDDYIKALDTHIDIHKATITEYNRISELTQRTNKCTNGIRITVNDIRECLGSGQVELYSVYVSDRFSDLGLVGTFAICHHDTLWLFSLSCRALGREIENRIIEYVKCAWKIKKVDFQSTEKNESIKTLLEKMLLF